MYGDWRDRKGFSDIVGKTIERIEGLDVDSKLVTFEFTDGTLGVMNHHQDCCESVYVYDIVGDVDDIIGSPILMAEEVEGDTPKDIDCSPSGSYTWTFYKIATAKGYVDIRWLGESNGYYSESVDFYLK